MNIFKYLWLRITRQPYPGWYSLFNFNLTKYLTFSAEITMGWGFGIQIREEIYPYSARLDWTFWKIYGYIGFGKSKA